MPCIYDALESTDWATRKAAAETLSRVGTNLGPALSSFKSTTLQVLEASRFDKIKPVRDSINDATQVWKNLPETEFDSTGSSAKTDVAEPAGAMRRLESRSQKEANASSGQSPANGNKVENSSEQLTKSSEKYLEAVKKRIPLVTGKKLNPEFFQKLNTKDSDDWQVEVAVPRSLPPQQTQDISLSAVDGKLRDDLNILKSKAKKEQALCGNDITAQDTCTNSKRTELITPENRNLTAPEDLSRIQGLRNFSVREGILDGKLQKSSIPCTQNTETNGCGLNTTCNDTHSDIDENLRWQAMQKQLSQMEQQQSNLLQMVQEIMVSSQESISALKARIWDLENVVEGLLSEIGSYESNSFNIAALGLENNGMRLPGRYATGSDYGSSRLYRNDGFRFLADRVNNPDSLGKSLLRHNPQKVGEASFDDWDDVSFRGSLPGTHVLESQTMGRRATSLLKLDTEDMDGNHGCLRRLWDRVTGPVRLGEGPSARSVWQASKDEATLAAIRVAGEDSEHSEMETHSTTTSQLALQETETDVSRHKSANGFEGGKGQSWGLWGTVIEFIQAGDMDSAYTEILCAEDEHMLVRLMNRTGPVVDQLSATTLSEVLHAVGALLQHQRYFDSCLCWIQQGAQWAHETNHTIKRVIIKDAIMAGLIGDSRYAVKGIIMIMHGR
ncbi:hypothetical protein KP509_1Z252200 [Ceratopteris richardii]|nr:hypothetical protein KP509_1Z252200 [Ceratopteris richardii]